MWMIVEMMEMFNCDLAYSVDVTKMFRAVCRRAGIPRHTNAPERRSTRGAPD